MKENESTSSITRLRPDPFRIGSHLDPEAVKRCYDASHALSVYSSKYRRRFKKRYCQV